MSVGKNSISRVVKKEEAPIVSEKKEVAIEPAKKVAPKKRVVAPAPRHHGNYVLITEELPVWLL